MANKKWVWERKNEKGYECSSNGDRRFSAFYAILKDGNSIEWHYQVKIKGYDSIREGKGRPSKYIKSRDKLYELYKQLWKDYFELHPELIKQLRKFARKKILTDTFANTDINQARAICDIMNELEETN